MKVFRYEVPVDGRWHEVTLSGPVVHVACRGGQAVVHFWALAGAGTSSPRQFRVFGTGHDVPEEVTYRGTGISEPFVWHLFEQA